MHRRIDRFTGRDVRGPIFLDDVVRMRHLKIAVEAFDLAADQPARANGMLGFKATDTMKIDQGEPYRAILRLDALRSSGCRRRVTGNRNGYGLDLSDAHLIQRDMRTFDD